VRNRRPWRGPKVRRGCWSWSCVLLARVTRLRGHDLWAGMLGHPGTLLVSRDEFPQRAARRSSPGTHVAGTDLALLNEHVRVQRDTEQIVGGVAPGEATAAPV